MFYTEVIQLLHHLSQLSEISLPVNHVPSFTKSLFVSSWNIAQNRDLFGDFFFTQGWDSRSFPKASRSVFAASVFEQNLGEDYLDDYSYYSTDGLKLHKLA